MIVIPVKIKCDHCERFHEQDVELEHLNSTVIETKIRYIKGPPMGWVRRASGYVCCISCQEPTVREEI